MSVNWLHGAHRDADQPDQQAMPVFEGQKLVVVGGSSGMGRDTAADVVAAGGSAVIIGQEQDRVDDTVKERRRRRHGRTQLTPQPAAGTRPTGRAPASYHPTSTSTAAMTGKLTSRPRRTTAGRTSGPAVSTVRR
ncbi:MAG TPA: hypothetical protein VKU77_32555 [Streptosporangiaceae bacterium]|nr:hypothetical protein [Streptosporangiaceae bacterium]